MLILVLSSVARKHALFPGEQRLHAPAPATESIPSPLSFNG
jgi:hypothetical protein